MVLSRPHGRVRSHGGWIQDMHSENNSRMIPFLSGLICGVAIGAGVALLLAPASGKKARKRLQQVAGDLKGLATDQWDEVADDVRDRVAEVLSGARKRPK
ncbi:MAG: YtxH domain-containing protein [Gemmatimonadetes bacterium]|nr:YtxH domain-containing protein [Gemmatimonadota bacterium]